MTVGEVLGVFDEGSFMDDSGFVLGVDMSEENSLICDDFTALTEGVCSVKAEMSPRIVMRDYVDGDRAVPLSKSVKITLRMLIIKGNAMQRRIFSAAAESIPLRCVYMSSDGVLFSGNMIASVSNIQTSTVYGMAADVVFLPC